VTGLRHASSEALPEIASVVNLRDVGGHPTRAGRHVRRGLLYRAAELDHVSEADVPALDRLGIRTVFDLRTEEERVARPDRLPAGATYRVADVLAGAPGDSPAAMQRTFADPVEATRAFGDGRGKAFFRGVYRDLVVLDSARAAYRSVFDSLARSKDRPALIHCTTGKDRTGWAAAALLLFLDVPTEAIMDDFLVSTRALGPALQPFLDAFEARGGDPEVLRPLVGVHPEYLEIAIAEMNRAFGSIDGYFADGLGLDADARRALRTAFVEPG
jgi:protein-tyrosine phosphatase